MQKNRVSLLIFIVCCMSYSLSAGGARAQFLLPPQIEDHPRDDVQIANLIDTYTDFAGLLGGNNQAAELISQRIYLIQQEQQRRQRDEESFTNTRLGWPIISRTLIAWSALGIVALVYRVYNPKNEEYHAS